MYQILKKQTLNANTKLMVIDAPHVARKAEPGQFIILRVSEDGERIPLTIADYNRETGVVTIIFQEVGATTMALGAMNEGDCLHDFVGPLGKASELEGLKKVAVVGGGRLTVGGETKFACVDGPDFDGHLVDFDSAMRRGAMYKAQEKQAVERREDHCNLFKMEVK